MNSILNVPMSFIENSIKTAIETNRPKPSKETLLQDSENNLELVNTYFVGQGLCLDVKGEDKLRVITLSWSNETFGYFDGGNRRLLSIKALKLLSKLMDKCSINYEPKPMLS